MALVSSTQLSRDMQASARLLTEQVGLVPQAYDRPLDAQDLLFYLTQTSMPMASFMHRHGLYMDEQGLHFDLTQFDAIRQLAEKVVTEHRAGDTEGVWKDLDLSGDEDADYDGNYILVALNALDILYGQGKGGDLQP